ncbi:hypothetical protein H310_09972 [Aphanomyces invadans]|uniref:Uncharacterized protein n=1 Tax=Aphanomyces invadans TaxID=157072 RepID=A0A024TU70_9STRA|nr:hypothetical protein H310_09972 [Aphanomyces invadans]ETV97176.1 hypothetical protein H310_09972 [Aphanomyces invadans]|eukprot:XP_008874422.1 hypothetical protein H310_09972 [Aphanomyces invadans]
MYIRCASRGAGQWHHVHWKRLADRWQALTQATADRPQPLAAPSAASATNCFTNWLPACNPSEPPDPKDKPLVIQCNLPAFHDDALDDSAEDPAGKASERGTRMPNLTYGFNVSV